MNTALTALLLLSLTACQAFPPGTGAGDAGDAAAEAGSDGDAGAGSGLDAAGEEQATRARWVSPPAPPEPPVRPELSEQRLTGLTTNQVWGLLGPPSEVEQESPATVWTYRLAGCRLELFFYFDLESQEQRTLALDLEAGSDFVGSRPFCWYSLAQRGRGSETPGPQAEPAEPGPPAGEGAAGPAAGRKDSESDPDGATPATGAAPAAPATAAGGDNQDASAQGESAQ